MQEAQKILVNKDRDLKEIEVEENVPNSKRLALKKYEWTFAFIVFWMHFDATIRNSKPVMRYSVRKTE